MLRVGLQVYREYLLRGQKYMNGTFFGPFGVQGIKSHLGLAPNDSSRNGRNLQKELY